MNILALLLGSDHQKNVRGPATFLQPDYFFHRFFCQIIFLLFLLPFFFIRDTQYYTILEAVALPGANYSFKAA